MDNCIFCKIVKGEMASRVVYENEDFIAFLTPFPNTDGFTVIATKAHYSSYIFDLPEDVYIKLLLFSKVVGKILDKTLKVKRTGMIFEGMGVDHAHVKLIPLHGIEGDEWEAVSSNKPDFYKKYPGYIASHDGPRQSDEKLDLIHQTITRKGE